MYKQMLKELKARREAIVSNEEHLTKLVEAGSTQGLGTHLEDAHALVDKFDERRDRILHKELLRSLPVEHLRQLYTRVGLFMDRQGLSHPENHPMSPAQLNKAGSTPLVEVLTENYNMRPRELIDDVFKRPDTYPTIQSSDQATFDAIRKFVEGQ